jgi:hypothetical protein
MQEGHPLVITQGNVRAVTIQAAGLMPASATMV